MGAFSSRLKELRKKKNLTQKQMAQFLNVTERGYQNYEIGKSTPNYEVLLQLADYFAVSLDYLTGRENYLLDADGHITVKVPPDILNLDTDALRRELGQR